METTDQERFNRAIEEQRQKYMEASNELRIWHDASMTKENFWAMLSATAQAIMAQRGVKPWLDNGEERVGFAKEIRGIVSRVEKASSPNTSNPIKVAVF